MPENYAIFPPSRYPKSVLANALNVSTHAFIVTAVCCLVLMISGCGSGVSGGLTSGALQISPGAVDFGDVGVGQLANSGVTISNQNASPIVIAAMSITGQSFSVASTDKFPISIPPGGNHTISIGFTPVATADYSGDLTVTDMTAHPIAQIAIHGRGWRNQHLTIATSSLSFGNVAVNTATTQSLTLTSTGTSPVTVSSAAISGAGFSIVGGTLPVTLNPSQSATLQVQFKPMAMGGSAGQVAINSDSINGATTTVSLSGIGAVAAAAATNPVLSVSASSLNFGIAAVNTISPQALTLTSTGTSAVTVNSAMISGAGFSIAGTTLPATLNPGQTLTLSVLFKPTVGGASTGQVTINSNSSTGSKATVSLSGTGVTPTMAILSVSASSLSFGSLTVNTATTKTLTLTSTGTSAVTVNSATISGAGFSIVGGTLPATLNPAQTLTLTVQFKPTTAAAATGQITINSNSSSGSTATVSLNGTGVATPKPTLSVSATNLSFGSLTVNTATTKTLTLTSTGTSAVTVSSAAISGAGFSIAAVTLPATLNPGQSLTLSVQFKPTTAVAATGQITINSNSSSGSTTAVSLSGTGTAANPTLSVSAASLSFGSLTVNAATTKTLTLTSTGTSAVTVSSAAVSGAGFSIVGGSFPVTLNTAQTLTLTLQFKPTAAGAVTGQVTIGSNSSSGTKATVSLSGTGVAVAHEVDLSWNPPSSSPSPVVGYNIYRSIGSGAFQLMNSSPDVQNAYADKTVVSGTTYNYILKSVGSGGVESVPSNEITLTIP